MPVSIDEENERRVVSYLMKHQGKTAVLTRNYFLAHQYKKTFVSLRKFHLQGYIFNIQDFTKMLQEELPEITEEKVQSLYNAFPQEDPNIGLCIEKLKKDYQRHQVIHKVLPKVLKKAHDPNAPIEEVWVAALDILRIPSEEEGKRLLNAEELSRGHQEIIKQRESGIKTHSIGFPELDEKITRPAAAEEMTFVLGLMGSGKTAWLINTENNLINKGICVASFNLDMPEESRMDRLISIRGDIPIKSLQAKRDDVSPSLALHRDHILREISILPNYMYFSGTSLSLDELDAQIYQAKESFLEKGSLPEDGYMVVSIDTVSLIDDFGDEGRETITKAVKKLSQIIKHHRVHLIGLIQANENKIRTGKMFKTASELDNYHLGLEDIYGGSAYAKHGRVVLSINRPLFLKERFFPQKDHKFAYGGRDPLNIHIIKQNDGPLGLVSFNFRENFRIEPAIHHK